MKRGSVMAFDPIFKETEALRQPTKNLGVRQALAHARDDRFGALHVILAVCAEVAVQTGELDGMAWSGITEDLEAFATTSAGQFGPALACSG